MKCAPADIGERLQQKFSGNLLYMPIHQTPEDSGPRPAALVFADIPSEIGTMDPRSIGRSNSGLHVQGLLHHKAEPQHQRKG